MALIHPCHPKISWDKAQNNGFPKSNPKSTFTIHDDIFQRPFELKIFMWALNISSTHHNNFQRVPEQFRISDFHLRKATKPVPAAPGHFWFLSRKNPRSFQNNSGTLQEFPGVCRNQFDLMVSPETTFQFYRNSSGDLSLQNFSAVSETFSGDFLSDSLSSIQQIDDP